MNPKISIIVPVYKVEPYIRKSVDSILTQTFTDFELILIDDGSPDSCGEICDDYARQDSRVIVIHKENGGLASARNTGLDIAKGDYIGFVDSDDWIESDMYELLYRLCVENDCDIANCTSKIYYPNRTIINGTHPFMIHDSKQAMETMLEGKLFDEVVWTKLIKRSLLAGIRFPVGMIYEDTAFTYQVIHKSNRVCCIGAPKYNYIKRDNSIMDRAIKNIRIDAVLIYEEMFKFFEINYPELTHMVALKLANSAMVVLNLISTSGKHQEYQFEYNKVSSILNRHFREVISLSSYPVAVKILLIATKINPLLYRVIINNLSRRMR